MKKEVYYEDAFKLIREKDIEIKAVIDLKADLDDGVDGLLIRDGEKVFMVGPDEGIVISKEGVIPLSNKMIEDLWLAVQETFDIAR